MTEGGGSCQTKLDGSCLKWSTSVVALKYVDPYAGPRDPVSEPFGPRICMYVFHRLRFSYMRAGNNISTSRVPHYYSTYSQTHFDPIRSRLERRAVLPYVRDIDDINVHMTCHEMPAGIDCNSLPFPLQRNPPLFSEIAASFGLLGWPQSSLAKR